MPSQTCDWPDCGLLASAMEQPCRECGGVCYRCPEHAGGIMLCRVCLEVTYADRADLLDEV